MPHLIDGMTKGKLNEKHENSPLLAALLAWVTGHHQMVHMPAYRTLQRVTVAQPNGSVSIGEHGRVGGSTLKEKTHLRRTMA